VLAGLWLVSETEMGTSYVGRWEGGEVQELEDGSRAYVLSRRIRGRRFRFSTRAAILKEARVVYRRFIADPDAFQLVAPPPERPCPTEQARRGDQYPRPAVQPDLTGWSCPNSRTVRRPRLAGGAGADSPSLRLRDGPSRAGLGLALLRYAPRPCV